MREIVLTSIFALFVLAVAEACTKNDCPDGTCCLSTRRGEECCVADQKCDSQLGCVHNSNVGSRPSRLGACPPGTTLCYSTIFYDACCPYPLGVCCEDMIHCCPYDYECDIVHEVCTKEPDICDLVCIGGDCCKSLEKGESCCSNDQDCDSVKGCVDKKYAKFRSVLSSFGLRSTNKSGRHHCGGNVWCPQEDQCSQDENGNFSCRRSFQAPHLVRQA